jgi:hypothetical protein
MRQAGIDVSRLGNGGTWLDHHQVLRLGDLAPGKTRNTCDRLAEVTMFKAMRLNDLPNKTTDLRSGPVRNIRMSAKLRPANSPSDPGLHIARVWSAGNSEYVYWFGMAQMQHSLHLVVEPLRTVRSAPNSSPPQCRSPRISEAHHHSCRPSAAALPRTITALAATSSAVTTRVSASALSSRGTSDPRRMRSLKPTRAAWYALAQL